MAEDDNEQQIDRPQVVVIEKSITLDVNIKQSERSIHTIEERRQYEYEFDTNLSANQMSDRGRKNWEAVFTMTRDGDFGILYKKVV